MERAPVKREVLRRLLADERELLALRVRAKRLEDRRVALTEELRLLEDLERQRLEG